MLGQSLKSRSKSSSSSSGSVKLLHEHEVENRINWTSPLKDLFDILLEDNYSRSSASDRMIDELNLSPRGNSQGCKCTKIDCLKMYCECFSKGKLCNERCECHTCCNKDDHREHIYKAQQMANLRHPGTFKGVPAWVPLRRCTCKKSECKKNYCDCFRAGLKCTEYCECLDCQNGKPHAHDDNYFESRMEIEVNA
jgi:hypothetical protein